MSVRYYVLASDELMDSGPAWPPVLRPVERAGYAAPAGMHWWLFEDDEGPAELDSSFVELTFARVNGEAVITDRAEARP